MFEGEYVNGSGNGKGKDYNWGKLIFEGEYINEIRNGKGKEYNLMVKSYLRGNISMEIKFKIK